MQHLVTALTNFVSGEGGCINDLLCLTILDDRQFKFFLVGGMLVSVVMYTLWRTGSFNFVIVETLCLYLLLTNFDDDKFGFC